MIIDAMSCETAHPTAVEGISKVGGNTWWGYPPGALSVLTHWDQDKMAILQMTLPNACAWMKLHVWILLKISVKFVP